MGWARGDVPYAGVLLIVQGEGGLSAVEDGQSPVCEDFVPSAQNYEVVRGSSPFLSEAFFPYPGRSSKWVACIGSLPEAQNLNRLPHATRASSRCSPWALIRWKEIAYYIDQMAICTKILRRRGLGPATLSWDCASNAPWQFMLRSIPLRTR